MWGGVDRGLAGGWIEVAHIGYPPGESHSRWFVGQCCNTPGVATVQTDANATVRTVTVRSSRLGFVTSY